MNYFIVDAVIIDISYSRYKALDPAASVMLPNFAALSELPYDWGLVLRATEAKCNCTHRALPIVILHKFRKLS